MIYFDNSATSLHKPQTVYDAMDAAYRSEAYGNPSRGAYPQALDGLRALHKTRKKLSGFFGTKDPKKVALTSNVTTALNLVLNSILKPGDHVITTDQEHNSVLRPLYRMEDQGVSLDFLPLDEEGCVRISAFKNMIGPNTRAVVLNHGSNVTGALIDLREIGRYAKERDIICILDAAQTAGTRVIDVCDLGVDILCFTGHKSLYGPQGTGGIIMNVDLDSDPVFVGGSGFDSFNHLHPDLMPERFEYGTPNVVANIGLYEGISFIERTGLDRIEQHLNSLRRYFYASVRSIPGVRVYGPKKGCPVVSLNIGTRPSGEVAGILSDRFGICVRSGAHCAPRVHEHFGTQAQGMVRFSFGWTNNMQEIDRALEAIESLI